jgi:hypothetical protein
VLAGDLGDEVEVRVVVQDADAELLCCGGDEQVGDLAAPFAAAGEQALDLQRAAHMGRRRVDLGECFERSDELVPFACGAGRVADFEIADAGTGEFAGLGYRLDDVADYALTG